jgi:hypothetical protein
VDIFDHPPFLHLGGDEVDMSEPCFQEVGATMYDYSDFEQGLLKDILKDIGYPESQVVRWQTTTSSDDDGRDDHLPEDQNKHLRRAGTTITQFWESLPGEKENDATGPFFGSAGLYFDTNINDDAWNVFENTRKIHHINSNNSTDAHNSDDDYPLLGIIAGTFELGERFWYDRPECCGAFAGGRLGGVRRCRGN